MTPEVTLRLGKPEDLEFILATWLRTYRHHSQFAKKISNKVFYENHQNIIQRIIERGAQIRVVHPIGEPDTILGYSCVENNNSSPVVHFVYVKKAFREFGLAKTLVWETEGYFSHLTSNLELARHPGLIYNPYLV